MHVDPITEEFRAIRRSLAGEFNNDLARIVADLRRREQASGRTFARLPKRPARSNAPTEARVQHAIADDRLADG